MKILQIVNSFKYAWSAGGVARVAYELSLALTKKGHRVTVFTTDKGLDDMYMIPANKSVIIDGVEVYYFKNLSGILAKKGFAIPYYSPWIIKKKVGTFDIIHIHEFRRLMNVPLYYFAKRQRIPYVLQAHGSVFPSEGLIKKNLGITFDIFVTHKLLKDASKVIALNRFEAEQYKAMGVPEEKIAIIPNGIDLSEYTNLPPKGSFKIKHNIPEDKKIILYLGRIHKIKGIDFLIKAYAYLVKKKDYKDAILVIAGPDDGYLNEAKALAKSLSIDDLVMFTGPLYGRDKLEAYVDADVYVLPSRYETFPMTVLEAYACSKPVIASNIGGLKDLVVNSVTGLLFEAGNIEELAKSIHYLLNNYSKAEEMGLKGRKFIEENFTIDKVIAMLEALYEHVLLFHKTLMSREMRKV